VCEDALNRKKEARNQCLNAQHNIEKEIAYKECQKSASRVFRNENIRKYTRKYTRNILEEAKVDSRMKYKWNKDQSKASKYVVTTSGSGDRFKTRACAFSHTI